MQRLTVDEYIETVRSAVGVDIAKEAHELLPPDLRADGFSNTAYNLNVDLKHVEAYAQLAELIVERMDVLKFAGRFSKSRSLNTDATARKFVADVGEWLLRGPLDDREVTNYSGILTAVASAGGSYRTRRCAHGGGDAAVAAVHLPHRTAARRRRRSARGRLRTRLADELHHLGRPARCRTVQSGPRRAAFQPRSMPSTGSADAQGSAGRQAFEAVRLRLAQSRSARPTCSRTPNAIPDWEPALGRDMRDETLAFFEEVVWKQNRPLSDLFNAQFTYATPRLARHYGLKPKGEGLQRYDLSQRPFPRRTADAGQRADDRRRRCLDGHARVVRPERRVAGRDRRSAAGSRHDARPRQARA